MLDDVLDEYPDKAAVVRAEIYAQVAVRKEKRGKAILHVARWLPKGEQQAAYVLQSAFLNHQGDQLSRLSQRLRRGLAPASEMVYSHPAGNPSGDETKPATPPATRPAATEPAPPPSMA